MQNVWSEVLRCVSRWELLQQLHSGGPTDALLFSPPPAESPASNPLMKLRDRLLMRTPAPARHFGGQSEHGFCQPVARSIFSKEPSFIALDSWSVYIHSMHLRGVAA